MYGSKEEDRRIKQIKGKEEKDTESVEDLLKNDRKKRTKYRTNLKLYCFGHNDCQKNTQNIIWKKLRTPRRRTSTVKRKNPPS